MKIGEVIQRVQSLYSKGVQSDDSRLSSRHIYNKMLTVRSRLIYQKANKKQKLNQWNFQTLPCVEMIPATVHECPCIPPVGCQILRTKYPLPKPVTSIFGHLMQSVTSLDGSVIYSETSWNEYKYKNSKKYAKNKPDFFIRNEHLYITYKTGPRIISITGLFEDPLIAANYPSYCDEDCEDCQNCQSYEEQEFPIDNELLDVLIEFCVQELVILFSQSFQDTTNNTKDDNQTDLNG